MEQEELMSVDEFCLYYNTEFSFINSLHEHGLIEITIIENATFINKTQLHDLEKFVRLHYEMDINLEGIEAINHLLQRINSMQLEITKLKNKLLKEIDE
jgi:chaperone modulatory protein CbpM